MPTEYVEGGDVIRKEPARSKKTWQDALPDKFPVLTRQKIVSSSGPIKDFGENLELEGEPEPEEEKESSYIAGAERREMEEAQRVRAETEYKEKIARELKASEEKALPKDSFHSPEHSVNEDSPLEVRKAYFDKYGVAIGKFPPEKTGGFTEAEASWFRKYDPERYAELLRTGRFDKLKDDEIEE